MKKKPYGHGGPIDKAFQKAVKDAVLKAEKVQEEERHPKLQPRIGVCVVCGGKVTEEFESTTTRPFDQIPMGPASRQYFVMESTGLHCVDCGLSYHQLPKGKK